MNPPHQSKPWYVLGAGALGCLWAWHGTAGGLEMRLILRHQERLQQYRQSGGISLIRAARRHTLPCPGILTEQIDTPIERLLVCCKAQDTLQAVNGLVDKLHPAAAVVLLQNGMGVAEEFPGLAAQQTLFAAVSTDGAHRTAPFTVQRAGSGTTRIGLHPREPEGQAGNELCRELAATGLDLEFCRDIALAQWQKLSVSALINPLTALLDIDNGDLFGHPEAAPRLESLAREIAAVANAMGRDTSAQQILATAAEVCRKTARNVSSMRQDLRHGRSTEIAYINGYLQRRAEENGLRCPVNRQLIERIQARERRPSVDR